MSRPIEVVPPRPPSRAQPAWVALAALAWGCSSPDSDVLATGRGVAIQGPDSTPVGVWTEAGEVKVVAGTRATVLADREAEPPVQPTLRLVKVRITTGPLAGREGEVSRYMLRMEGSGRAPGR